MREVKVMDRQRQLRAARAQQARANLVAALRECCELADAVENFEGEELLEVLIHLDSLRFVMAESAQILQGVIRGFEQ
jgi:NTP pyrophosphatase (non-canonical NTP hydrolase)